MPAPRIPQGAFDLHVHSAPDLRPRSVNDWELCEQAIAAGIRGMILKSHWTETATRASLLRQQFPRLEIHGSLCLNSSVGGLNPEAVKTALNLGAKEIWMPTVDAANPNQNSCEQAASLSLLGKSGNLRPDVKRIIRMVAEAGVILGTGHVLPEETRKLVPVALAGGVRRILITHPEWPATYFSPEEQKRLVTPGRVFFERCYVSTKSAGGSVPIDEIIEGIRTTGPEHTVLTTDFGVAGLPTPAEAFGEYLELIRRAGLKEREIVTMVVDNPTYLLAL